MTDDRWISGYEIHTMTEKVLAQERAATAAGEPAETETRRVLARLDDGTNDLRRLASGNYRDEREAFEQEFGRQMVLDADDLAWDAERNGYRQFITHFAWKAWQARSKYKGRTHD
jgi:hypothetical protein